MEESFYPDPILMGLPWQHLKWKRPPRELYEKHMQTYSAVRDSLIVKTRVYTLAMSEYSEIGTQLKDYLDEIPGWGVIYIERFFNKRDLPDHKFSEAWSPWTWHMELMRCHNDMHDAAKRYGRKRINALMRAVTKQGCYLGNMPPMYQWEKIFDDGPIMTFKEDLKPLALSVQ